MSRGALAILFAATAVASEPQLVERDVYLMGTRAHLVTYAPDRQTGVANLGRALTALERTDAQLSTWQEHSAISRLNRATIGMPWSADNGLCELFGDLFAWQAATAGTFDPAIGPLTTAWGIHEDGAVPTDLQLADARRRSGLHHLDFDGERCTVTRRTDVTVDVGAFGKGEALDRAARVLAGSAWMIDLGGQVAVGGRPPDGKPWTVRVAHPVSRDRSIMQVRLTSGSLSTSGSSERDLRVGNIRVGHILDPRTGKPATFAGAVVVWHERALVADILSTALYVMGPDDGLRWASARGIAAAYLMPEAGSARVAATDAWVRLKPDTTY